MSTAGQTVKVYIYDLSKGMARAMSQAFLGKQINGIWHTGIVVYGKEFYYGGTGGIECCPPGGTILGQPDTIQSLGETQIPYEMFIDYLKDLSLSTYRPERYHLLEHNCNTFSSDVAQFLTGNDIPAQITGLPSEVLATPFGQMIKPFIDSMSVQPSGGTAVFPNGVATGHQSQPKTTEQSKPKTETKPQSPPVPTQKTNHTQNDFKPFIFDQDGAGQIKCEELKLSSLETLHLREIYEYLASTDNMWSPGREHLNLLIRLVFESQMGCVEAVLNALGRLMLKEDIIYAFQHDPKSTFPELIEKFECCGSEVKGGILKVLTNCSSQAEGCRLCLNEKLQKSFTTVCVSGVLDDDLEVIKSSAALCYNVICSQAKMLEDTELELGSALLTCCGKPLDEQTGYHILSAVCTLVKRNEEVKGLAGVLGVDVENLQTLSPRVKGLCDHLKQFL